MNAKISCYDCKYGTWDDEKRMNDCHHEQAAYAVANYTYNRECPYFEIKESIREIFLGEEKK